MVVITTAVLFVWSLNCYSASTCPREFTDLGSGVCVIEAGRTNSVCEAYRICHEFNQGNSTYQTILLGVDYQFLGKLENEGKERHYMTSINKATPGSWKGLTRWNTEDNMRFKYTLWDSRHSNIFANVSEGVVELITFVDPHHSSAVVLCQLVTIQKLKISVKFVRDDHRDELPYESFHEACQIVHQNIASEIMCVFKCRTTDSCRAYYFVGRDRLCTLMMYVDSLLTLDEEDYSWGRWKLIEHTD